MQDAEGALGWGGGAGLGAGLGEIPAASAGMTEVGAGTTDLRVGWRSGAGWNEAGGGLIVAGVLACAATRKCALPLCGAANEWTCR